MNIEKAITSLKRIRGDWRLTYAYDCEAIGMAIQALQDKKRSEEERVTYCSNCIHYRVCGNEGVDDVAMTFCDDKQTDGDLINKSVLDQIKWERDIAISQLNVLGYELGEKPRAEKTAEWNYERFGYRTCSNCGYSNVGTDDDGVFIPNNYCPNCGAKMKEEEE